MRRPRHISTWETGGVTELLLLGAFCFYLRRKASMAAFKARRAERVANPEPTELCATVVHR